MGQVHQMEEFVSSVVAGLPASRSTNTCQQILNFNSMVWPRKDKLDFELHVCWKAKDSFSVGEGLLLFNSRIVVPISMQKEVLSKLHHGHQGVERCLLHARCSVQCPGISHQITRQVQDCPVFARNTRPRKEPLIPTPLPPYPCHYSGNGSL